ncbi:MAG: hypothetical protein AB7T63_04990 [Planctomycetota bacterium]
MLIPRRHLGVVLGTVLLVASSTVRAEDARLEKAVASAKAKIAAVWRDLASDLAEHGAGPEARDALARARREEHDAKELAALAARVEALPDGEATTDAKLLERIRDGRADAAKAYDRLAKVLAKEENDPRRSQALVQALVLDPSTSRLKKIADEAKKKPVLFSTAEHEAVAYVSLPSSWKPGGSYPVLVSVEGAGAGFLGNANAFRNGRGSRPFITVSPHALSCSNAIDLAKFPAYDKALVDRWDGNRLGFDVPGLLAMLDFLRAHFGAQERVAITGFSGGGLLCYGFLLRHPDRVAAAAPACPNFLPSMSGGDVKPKDGGPPVQIFTGALDPHRDLTHGKTPPGIEEQTDQAMEALKEAGFTNVRRTMLEGVGHIPCVDQVWAFVDEVGVGGKG